MMNLKCISIGLLTLIITLALLPNITARYPYQTCCPSSSHCVVAGVCYSSGSTGPDVDEDGDNDYCLNQEWWDCAENSESPAQCKEQGYVCYNHDCVDPESASSACNEFWTGIGNTCCGNDANEYVIVCSKSRITWDCFNGDVCYDDSNDCVDGSGNCMDTISGYSGLNPGGNDDTAYCDLREWYDCDDELEEVSCGCATGDLVRSGEAVGEYTDSG